MQMASEFLGRYYEWLRAAHILSVIAWMAALLYMPRLFVYHAGAAPGSELSETFTIMEERLYRIIMSPAMHAAWAFGLLMLFVLYGPITAAPGSFIWLYVKLAAVVAMTVLHVLQNRWRKQFAAGANVHSHRFFRIWNEAPAVLAVIIVIAAVVQPFA